MTSGGHFTNTRALLAAAFLAAIYNQGAPARLVFAQTPASAVSQGNLPSPEASSVAFEAASIRPAALLEGGGEGNSRSQIQYSADGLTMSNVDVEEAIQWAYGLQHFQLAGAHLWNGQRYDIRAGAAEGTSPAALRLMLQNLLAARFEMRVHWEQKRASVYELVVDRGGPRLPENKAGLHLPSYPKESLPRVSDGNFVFTNVTLQQFADQLAELRGIDRPVVDRTGIQGIYDITLKSAASAILDSDEFSLPGLIQKQLGLKLVPAKDVVPFLVVDQVGKPSPN